jgi:hypothetical protein
VSGAGSTSTAHSASGALSTVSLAYALATLTQRASGAVGAAAITAGAATVTQSLSGSVVATSTVSGAATIVGGEPTLVTYTIRPDGLGDYLTLAEWQAAEVRDIVASNEQIIVEIQGDWSAAPDSTYVLVTGWTTSASNNIVIRTDAANRAGGYYDQTKYRLERVAACMSIESDHVTVSGLQIRITSTTVTYADVLRVNTGDGFTTHIEGCFLVCDSDGIGSVCLHNRYTNAAWTRTVNVHNCIVVATAPNPVNVWLASNNLTTANYRNCTGYGGQRGFYRSSGAVYYTNCIATNTVAAGFGGALATNYCVTETVLAGTGNVAGTPNFVSPALLDFRLDAEDTVAKGAGTDLSDYLTSDIDGYSRGATFDIGASQAAELVTKTVRPDGLGDYVSLGVAVSSESANLIALHRKLILLIEGDWSAGPDTGTVSMNYFANNDRAHHVTVRTDSANRATAKWDASKYVLEKTNAHGIYHSSNSKFTRIEGLQIHVIADATSGAYNAIYYQGSVTEVRVTGCLLWCQCNGNGSVASGIFCANYQYKLYAANNIAFHTGSYAAYNYGFYSHYGIDNYLYNNTAVGDFYCAFRCNNQTTLKNCISDIWGGGLAYIGVWLPGSTNNASSTASSASGATNSTANVVFTYVDAANHDYHLSATDTGALDQGADLSSDPVFPITTDIDGNLRSVPWDIGASEFVAATGGTTHSGAGTCDALSSTSGAASKTTPASVLAGALASAVVTAGLLLTGAGASSSTSTVSGAPALRVAASGASTSTSTVTGSASAFGQFGAAGTSQAASAVSGVCSLTQPASGASTGQAGTSAGASRIAHGAAVSSGASTSQAGSLVYRGAAAVVSAQGIATGVASTTSSYTASGHSASFASITGAARLRTFTAGASGATGSVSGYGLVSRPAAGATTAAGGVSGASVVVRGVYGASGAQSSILGAPTRSTWGIGWSSAHSAVSGRASATVDFLFFGVRVDMADTSGGTTSVLSAGIQLSGLGVTELRSSLATASTASELSATECTSLLRVSEHSSSFGGAHG